MKLSRLVAVACVSIASVCTYIVHADTLEIDNVADVTGFIPLHFTYGDNDFGGFILSYAKITLPESQPAVVTFSDATLSCKEKRNGFYVSLMRGTRILPLNTETLATLQSLPWLNYRNLSVAGGLYTNCTRVGAPLSEIRQTKDSTVGAIIYTRDGDYGGIYAGGSVNTATNSIGSNFANSLKAVNGTLAQGFLYDSMGGGLSQISYPYSTKETTCTVEPCSCGPAPCVIPGTNPKGIGIEGKVGVSKTLESSDKLGLQDTIGKNATVYGVDDINASLVIRTVSKNTQNLCRGAIFYPSLDAYTNLPQDKKAGIKTICLDDSASNTTLIFNANIANQLQSKDIVVRNRKIVLSTNFTGGTTPINLFVDRGNVQIDSQTGVASLQSFDAQGRIDTTNGITKGGYIKGNIFINGLMLGKDNQPVVNKLYIHGKFTSLNLPGTSVGRQEQVQQLFANLGDQESSIIAIYKSFISLQNVFVWACDPLTNSGTVATNNNISCSNTDNIYRNKSLIIIDTPYPTNLLIK